VTPATAPPAREAVRPSTQLAIELYKRLQQLVELVGREVMDKRLMEARSLVDDRCKQTGETSVEAALALATDAERDLSRDEASIIGSVLLIAVVLRPATARLGITDDTAATSGDVRPSP
jgi:hypothetical protein